MEQVVAIVIAVLGVTTAALGVVAVIIKIRKRKHNKEGEPNVGAGSVGGVGVQDVKAGMFSRVSILIGLGTKQAMPTNRELATEREEEKKEKEEIGKRNGQIFIDECVTIFEITKKNACTRIDKYIIRAASDGVREMKLKLMKTPAHQGTKQTLLRGGEMTEVDKDDHILHTIRFLKELRKDEKHEVVLRMDVYDLTAAPYSKIAFRTFAGFRFVQHIIIFPEGHLENIYYSYMPDSTGVDTEPKPLLPERFPSFSCDHEPNKQFVDLKIMQGAKDFDCPANKDYVYQIGWRFVAA